MRARRTALSHALVRVTTRGEVPAEMSEYAVEKVGQVYRYTDEPILSAHVVLTLAHDPARQRPALAEVSLQFGATQVRAQAATEHMMGAIDLLVDRLQRRLVQHQNRVRSRHRWLAEGSQHEWRHGDLPSRRLEHFPRPPQDREVVRRKTFAVDPMTADEAAFDMDLLGHDFYLFADLDSGKDAVIYRTSEGRYAILGDVSPRAETAAVVEYGGKAARLDEHQAKAHLDIAAEPFVFYIDRDSGRGRVLYLRYDGHYGLIAAD